MPDRNTELDGEAPGPENERRKFLQNAGKFAVLVPPAMTFLLTTTLASPAIAQSATSSPRWRKDNVGYKG